MKVLAKVMCLTGMTILTTVNSKAVETGKNLFQNPGFEKRTASFWRIKNEEGSSINTDVKFVHTGRTSLKIENSGEKAAKVNSARVKVNSAKSYLFSFYIQCRDVQAVDGDGFYICVLEKFKGKKKPKWYRLDSKVYKLLPMTGSTDAWQKKEILIEGLPETISQCHFYFYLKGSGTVYIDDVSLKQVKTASVDKHINYVPNGNFELGVQKWILSQRSSGGLSLIQDKKHSRTGNASMKVTKGEDFDKIYTKAMDSGVNGLFLGTEYFRAKPGRMTLSFYMKASTGLSPGQVVKVWIYGCLPPPSALGKGKNVRILDEKIRQVSNKWQQYKFSVNLPKVENNLYKIAISIPRSSGKFRDFFLDGVSLGSGKTDTYIESTPLQLLLVPEDKTLIYTSGRQKFSIKMLSNSILGDVKIKCSVTDFDDKEIFSKVYKRELDNKVQELDLTFSLACGYYRLRARVYQGNKLLATEYMPFVVSTPFASSREKDSIFGLHGTLDGTLYLKRLNKIGLKNLRILNVANINQAGYKGEKSLKNAKRIAPMFKYYHDKGIKLVHSATCYPKKYWVEDEDKFCLQKDILEEYFRRIGLLYAPYIYAHEMYNEPIAAAMHKALPSRFARAEQQKIWMDIYSDTIKKYDPNAVFSAMCTSFPGYERLDALHKNGSLLKTDMLSYHHYYNIPDDGQFYYAIKELKKRFDKYRPANRGVIITESGWYVPGFRGKLKLAPFRANIYPGGICSEKEQAVKLIKLYMECYAAGLKTLYFFYESPLTFQMRRDNLCAIYHGDWNQSPKKVVAALATAIRHFDNKKFVKKIDYIDRKIRGYHFKGANNKAFILWRFQGKGIYSFFTDAATVKLYDIVNRKQSIDVPKNGVFRMKIGSEPKILVCDDKFSIRLLEPLKSISVQDGLNCFSKGIKGTVEVSFNKQALPENKNILFKLSVDGVNIFSSALGKTAKSFSIPVKSNLLHKRNLDCVVNLSVDDKTIFEMNREFPVYDKDTYQRVQAGSWNLIENGIPTGIKWKAASNKNYELSVKKKTDGKDSFLRFQMLAKKEKGYIWNAFTGLFPSPLDLRGFRGVKIRYRLPDRKNMSINSIYLSLSRDKSASLYNIVPDAHERNIWIETRIPFNLFRLNSQSIKSNKKILPHLEKLSIAFQSPGLKCNKIEYFDVSDIEFYR